MPPERRADLLFRAKNPGTELQLYEFRWINIDEANSDQENFFVVGEIIDIPTLVDGFKCDAWNSKDDPMSYRQGIKLKDRSFSPPKGNGQFWIMMYGTYAKYFKELQPQIGQLLTIVNPQFKHLKSFGDVGLRF